MSRPHRRIAKYAESLLLDGRRLGTVSAAKVNEIRTAYGHLANKLARSPQEALHIIRSVWYAVDSYLSTLPNEKTALAELCNTPAEALWQAGIRTLRKLELDVMLHAMRRNKLHLPIPNADYNQIPPLGKQFLSHYRIQTGAHKTSMQIPYTPVVPIPRQTGLYYLRLYYMFLYYEDRFCHDCGIENVLDCYGAYCFSKGDFDMEFLHVNIYKIMLVNAIFAQYLNYEQGTFFLERADIEVAERLLSSMRAAEQKEALERVVKRLPYGNSVYNLLAFSTLFPILHDAVSRGRLSELLLFDS